MAGSGSSYDAVVIGSGPNGLAAAIALARAGRSVLVREAMPTAGGGMRTEELTLPGFLHDVCSAAHPLGISSPFFRELPLEKHGLKWIHAPEPLAHPLDGGKAVLLKRSVEETAAALGADEKAYRDLFGPLVRDWDELLPDILGPMIHIPRRPVRLARFGLQALLSARKLVSRFHGEEAPALFGGIAAHSGIPLEWMASSAIGLVLGAAGHARGWPIADGGSRSIAQALVGYLESLGGRVEVGNPVQSLRELPTSRWIFFDVPPELVSRIAGEALPKSFRAKLESFRPGNGVFKLDWALGRPIPWTAPDCARAGTVHIGGTFDELSESERRPAAGKVPDKPYVLLTQPSLFDSSRAPIGKHVAWGYCHVPNGSKEDMTARIEAQIERFAPGFSEIILKRNKMFCRDLEKRNPALLGGDISHGAVDFMQVLARPRAFYPYRTPSKKIYMCSSSTPPGPGVHGMCGFLAAQDALSVAR
jgi:phytoene dehydrogenase-like protein